ncbi:MAG: UDP-3-O-(3-hydroxymyristoyl)glucosamine N-acyltransferase [Pseudomonadota bacterium]|nr:UDP-3-O-(3-hydroxymyristoyl)glucosamine N-acyltransferase [Pseudomonadota bacterium]
MTLAEIAAAIGAQLQGDGNAVVHHLASIERADKDTLTFISKSKFTALLKDTQAGAVICKAKQAQQCPTNALIVDDPYLAYAKASALFATAPKRSASIHPTAHIDPTASVAASAHIGAHVVIEEGVSIGEQVQIDAGCVVGAHSRLANTVHLFANVTLYHDCHIGERTQIHSGTVIGADGFGYAPSKLGWVKIEQVGRVIIQNDCHIGANCTIDRGAIEDTIIEQGVILDNQIQIAHNVVVGEGTAMAAQVGIAGSTQIGKRCIIGGSSGLAGHIELADDVYLSGGTMVNSSIRKPGQYSSATVAQPHRQWLRNAARFNQLSDMYKRLQALEEQLQELERDD